MARAGRPSMSKGISPRNGPERTSELQRDSVVVPELSTRECNEHAGARTFVRCSELLPRMDRTPEGHDRVARPVPGQLDGSPGMCGHRSQHRRVELLGNALQVRARGIRLVELALCKGDLDLRGQHGSSIERLRAFRNRSGDRGRRGAASSLREAKQRQTGLRLVAQLAGTAVRILGSGIVALRPVNLAFAVERVPSS